MRWIVPAVVAVSLGLAGCKTTGLFPKKAAMDELSSPYSEASASFSRPLNMVSQAAAQGLNDLAWKNKGVVFDFQLDRDKAARKSKIAVKGVKTMLGKRDEAEPTGADETKTDTAVISGETFDARPLRVVVTARDDVSHVTVKVGGDTQEAHCRALLERIGVRLGAQPIAPATAEARPALDGDRKESAPGK